MKKKIIVGICTFLVVMGIVLTFILINPKGSLNLKKEGLRSIKIVSVKQEVQIDSKSFEKFLEELNSLEYKDKQGDYKVKGDYTVILTYDNEVITIDRYQMDNTVKHWKRRFSEDFDILLKKYIHNK